MTRRKQKQYDRPMAYIVVGDHRVSYVPTHFERHEHVTLAYARDYMRRGQR